MNRNILLVTAMLTSFSSQAAYIDYRHEYLGEEEKREDRIIIGHQMENGLYASLEGKFESGTGGFLQNLSSKGNEFVVGYKMKPAENFTLAPSFTLDAGEKDTAYKFSLKGTYNLTEKFSLGARARYAIRQYDETSANEDRHYLQANIYVGYKFGDFAATYDYENKFKTDYPAYKGRDYDVVHNLNISWTGNKTWVPYIELGYVSYDDGSYQVDGVNYKSAWQMRYRVGITYNF